MRQQVDIAGGRGLEIGGLVRPIVTRDMGLIHYADHASTEELREKYAADPGIDVDEIVPVDFVWGSSTLAECSGDAAPFDYVIASHVIEHVPDIVGWLREVAEVLRPGGRLCLVVPDRRLTFDVRRRPSDVAEMVEAYLLRLRRPSLRAIFDHFSRHVEVDTGALWRGDPAYADDASIDLVRGWEYATHAAETGEYMDTHCWVFAASEFVDLLSDLMRMNLIDFKFVGFTPPPVGDFEFFVALEHLDGALSPSEKTSLGLDSRPDVETFPVVPMPTPDQLVGSSPLGEGLSPRELDLIRRKRAIMVRARSVVGRLTRRGG